MKLTTVVIQRYRSIVRQATLELSENTTTILGPNNEGKSNLLKAIVLAMNCLSAVRSPVLTRQKDKETNKYRLRQGVYDWNSDFPISLQDREPMGKTRITLTFELNDDECTQFKKETGSKTNRQLPIVMEVDDATVLFKVSKSGRGASNYSKSAPQIARFISSRFGFQYIPAIRPAELSLDLVNNLIDSELSKLETDPKYMDAMSVISSLQQPILHRIEIDVKQSLNQLLPSVKDVKINFDVRGGTYRSRLRNRTARFIVDDGVPTDIESKGDGIKSLAAIALMRSVNLNLARRDSLVAIEEPESHLHPEAV
ncbi:MAG TPA: AAA family ATPase, partial [Fimbriimonas sp.]|nr:AAA family ATPase [Fimbriimonas sp.]